MGAAHARALVAEGGKVVIGDILDDEGKALADELGESARYVHLDVTDAEQWEAAVNVAVEAFGKVTALVNNAAIVALGQIGKFDMAKWQKVIDVNLTGTFLGMQAVVEADEGGGRGLDHQRLVDRGAARRADGAPLRRIEMGGPRAGQVGGDRTGPQEHPGQLDPPGLHPYPDDQALPRRHGDRAAAASRASPKRCRRSWCSWSATSRRSRRVPSSSWTADW